MWGRGGRVGWGGGGGAACLWGGGPRMCGGAQFACVTLAPQHVMVCVRVRGGGGAGANIWGP